MTYALTHRSFGGLMADMGDAVVAALDLSYAVTGEVAVTDERGLKIAAFERGRRTWPEPRMHVDNTKLRGEANKEALYKHISPSLMARGAAT